MSDMAYLRPTTLEEALELLQTGIPLAGGTWVTPRRREVGSVIDLQALGMDGLERRGDVYVAGASLKLQSLLETKEAIPSVLRVVSRREVAWNLRNVATLAGTMMAADGRSPLLTALLALGVDVLTEPGGQSRSIDSLLDDRERRQPPFLITEVHIPNPGFGLYAQVARSPMDRPLVCAAVVGGLETGIRIAIGGYGERPIRATQAEIAIADGAEPQEVAPLAGQAYAVAGDQWTSAEYREHAAAVLVGRLLEEGIG